MFFYIKTRTLNLGQKCTLWYSVPSALIITQKKIWAPSSNFDGFFFWKYSFFFLWRFLIIFNGYQYLKNKTKNFFLTEDRSKKFKDVNSLSRCMVLRGNEPQMMMTVTPKNLHKKVQVYCVDFSSHAVWLKGVAININEDY